MAVHQLHEMITQPDNPAKFGELLSGPFEQQRNSETDYLSIFSLQPIDQLSNLERDILQSEQYVLTAEWFVEFIRQAVVDDEKTREFERWMGNEDLIEFVDHFVRRILKGALTCVCNQRKAATDIEDSFNSQIARSEPSNEQLFVHIRELEMLALQYVQRFKALIELFDNLQGNELVARLLVKLSELRPLTAAEKIRLLHSIRLGTPIDNPPSMSREDWYDDHGR